jgi:hypothetical protein
MVFQIDSNIPVPTQVPTQGRMKYPLKELKIGQSFFVPQTDLKKAKNLRSTFSVRAKKKGISIVSIADETGIRVWRTA